MTTATMNEIARLSGVSRATVSAVLNGKQGVREKTRQQVLETIREHGLEHRLLTPSLRVHFSQMFAIVVPDIKNLFYTEANAGFLDVMKVHGNHMLTYPTDGTHEDEVRTIGDLLKYNPAGCVVVASQRRESQEHLRHVLDRGIPLVLIGGSVGFETHTVDMENHPGGKLATDYLVAKGHRRIACLAGQSTSRVAKERALGFVESLMEHDIAFDDSMIAWTDATSEGGYLGSLGVLSTKTPPTALACFNDVVAIGAYRAAYELGMHVPEDISIIGFDDIEICKILGPPLTTISVRPRQVGEAAAEILIAVLKGEAKNGYIHRLIRASLVERGSVRELPEFP